MSVNTASGRSVEVHVAGVPVTQGSMRPTRFGSAGMRHSNGSALAAWRADIVHAFHLAYGDGLAPFDGPVSVDAVFTVAKPKSAPKRRITWPITRSSGDLDKLLRAVLDSCTTAGVWGDDSQVIEATARKGYPGETVGGMHLPGLVLIVTDLSPQPVEATA